MPTATEDDARSTQHPGAKPVELQHVSSFGSTVAPDTHEAILQGLNQWLPCPHEFVVGRKTYLGVDNFDGTEEEWNAAPMIFKPGPPVHPSNEALRQDAAAEIARIGGRIAGTVSDATIHTAGTPRLGARLTFSDPDVRALHAAGHLGQSTGYDAATYPTGYLDGKVVPSHILLFDMRYGVPPNDPKTMFLNLGETDMADDTEVKGLLSQILDGIKGLKAAPAAHANTPPPDESARLLEQANLAKKKADEDLAAANARLLEFENLEKKRAQDAADARWLEVKNTIPAGLTAKPEDETKERQAFEADPAGYAIKMIHANTNRAPDRQAQGASHANMGAPQKTDEERLAELGYTSLTVSGGEPA